MTDKTKVLIEAKHVFDTEIEALEKVKDSLDDTFNSIIEEILDCSGKVVITGMGKPGHIARKLSATFASLGVPSFFLHPAEAMHGDLGMVDEKDIVIAISYSGESDEIVRILPNIKLLGAKIIGITGNSESTLAKCSDIVEVFPKFKEACALGLAPTSSTTCALVYGDALAVVASQINDFKDIDFGKRHPAGSLGKKLILRVDDLMAKGGDLPLVSLNSHLSEAIQEISNKHLGAVLISNDKGDLVGIITDGDLRRAMAKHVDIYSMTVQEVMTYKPKSIEVGSLAYDALLKVKEYDVNCLAVLEDNKPVGLITWKDIINAGIVG